MKATENTENTESTEKDPLSHAVIAMAQTLSYLRATGLRKALLINFGEQLLKHGIKRVSL